MCQGQQLAILNKIKAILLIRSTQRILHPFLPKKNRRTDDLSEEGACRWTRFTKSQLHQLYIHLCLPWNVISPVTQTFTNEEILIISLMKCATGEAWTHMVPAKFGRDPRECSFIFK
jgi:hypothetical protein